MIKNIVVLSNKRSVNPVVARATGTPYSTSPIAHKNPILHQSNRIVTVGLLSSYGLLQTPSKSPYQVGINSTSKPSFTGELHPQLQFVSPRSVEGDKSAFNFKFEPQEKVVKIEGTNIEDKSIDLSEEFENKISLSIYLGEFAKILSVLTTTESELLITRTSEKGSDQKAKISFVLRRPKDETPKDESRGFLLQLSRQYIGVEKTSSITYLMNNSEAVLLTEFMRNSIRSGLGFTE